MTSKEEHLYKAKLAEQAERYDEMIESMIYIAKTESDLTAEQRNLFSLAHKNAIGPKRSAWRVVNIELENLTKKKSRNVPYMQAFREAIEKEIRDLARTMIVIIDKCLLKPTLEPEINVFYLKIKGDHFRYLAEFEQGNDRKDAAEACLEAYKIAYENATSHLLPTNPIRLGIALNFSVFYYEIINSSDRACKMAKQAFDDALAELDNISDENYKDSTLIMQLLRDNLTLWTTDIQRGEIMHRP